MRGTRIASITAVNWVQSLMFPPVTVKASGRPKVSQARSILLVRPDRERPRQVLRSPLSGPGDVLVGTDDGGVETDTSQSMSPVA